MLTGTLIVRPVRRPRNSSSITPGIRLASREASSGRIRRFIVPSTQGGGGGANLTCAEDSFFMLCSLGSRHEVRCWIGRPRHGRSDEEVVDGEIGDRHAARVAGRLEYLV